MGDYWFAAGLLLAILGPLLFIVPVAACYVLFRRIGVARRFGITQRGAQQAAHLLAALAVVAVTVAATWIPGRLEFARLCSALAEPRIYARVKADGFYLDDLTAYSFGQRYVLEEGFAWMEARDIYRRDGHVRYRRQGDRIVSEPIPALTAAYVVRSGVEVRAQTLHVARTEIAERSTGKLLAEAHSVIYHGGSLGPFLGVYGLRNCPDPATIAGSRQFNTYYHLVREVLGGKPAENLKNP